MTNNKVIIDGVDVSNCIAYDEEQCYGGYKYKWCKDNPNCSFKQLARKTQECEKLKSALEEIEKLIKQIGGGSVYANGRYKEIQEFINKAKEQECRID